MHLGDIITEAGGNQITGANDFNSLKFQPNQFISLVVNSGPGGCISFSNGTLGITTNDQGYSGIMFGVDLVGGTRYKIDTAGIPTSQLQNISHVLSIRTSYLNLPDVKIQNDGTLQIVAEKNVNVNKLLFPGYFEGAIQVGYIFSNNATNFMIGSYNYSIERNGDNYLINNKSYSLNNAFYLNNVKVTIANETNTSIILSFTVFNNSDILGEIPGYSQLLRDSNTGIYTFSTLVGLSSQAGKRFTDITQNIKTIVSGNNLNLDAALVFLLDGNEINRLGMPSTLKGQTLSNIYVVLSNPSQQNILSQKSIVEASIGGGVLPYNLTILSSEPVPPTQLNNTLPSLGIIVFAIAIVPLLIGGKFKKMKHNLISILIGSAELFSVISLFAALQIFYNLNLAFGFLALIGGVCSQ